MEHAIKRSIGAMTIGVVKSTREFEEERKRQSLRELEAQYQEQVSGTVGNVTAEATLMLTFETPFYFSPGTRDSDLDVPQFSSGITELSVSGVIIQANVSKWVRDEDTDAVTGAAIVIAAVAPGIDDPLDFAAVVHLTFQGYSAPVEDESELV